MNLKRHRSHLLSAVLLVSLSCGGGGGGGGGTAPVNTAPTLLSVTFFGAGAQPAAGDRLWFLMSDPVVLQSGAVLDAADFEIGGGGLVVSGLPSPIAPHVVEVTLGAGVALVAGTTTFRFGIGNDAVQDSGGLFAVDGAPRALRKADADDPTISSLTLSGVHGSLNGTGAAGGVLQVARTGFSIDLRYADGASAVDPSLTILFADRDVVAGGVGVPAGENLAPLLSSTADGDGGIYAVPGDVTFPEGSVAVSSIVADTSGRISSTTSFSFTVRGMTPALQPFETTSNPKQIWFLDQSRDLESFSVILSNPSTPVVVTAGANARSDLEDVLQVLGLWVAAPIPDVRAGLNSNEVVLDQFRTRVITELDTFFAGVNISFTFTAPGVFPNSDYVAYNSFGFSQICIAGSATTAGDTGVGGLAIFDPHNEIQENDCLVSFQGDRLGVFLHTIANIGYLSSPATVFAMTFNPFAPIRVGGGSGIPIGSHVDTQDGARLNNPLLDSRAGAMKMAIDDLARLVAVLVAHECGHSMGLVQNGAMPDGLFGNSPGFGTPGPGHLSMPTGSGSPFPSNSMNIMRPSIEFTAALNSGTRFNSLNLAYLREAVIYNSTGQ